MANHGQSQQPNVQPVLSRPKWIKVARSCAIAMCLDAAENPMMYVPRWVNIGWFQATRSSSSGKRSATQFNTSTIRARLSSFGMIDDNMPSEPCQIGRNHRHRTWKWQVTQQHAECRRSALYVFPGVRLLVRECWSSEKDRASGAGSSGERKRLVWQLTE